jgi:TetR/AcrR family transcriptional regulator, transcriptional repressor for nem operon
MIFLRDKNDTPRRLLEAGHRLFWRNGYNATGIQEITNAAGVPKGSFYNYFENKEQFAARVIENYAKWVSLNWDGLLQQEEIASEKDHVGRLRMIFDFFIDHHERSEFLGCMVGNMTAELSESSHSCTVVLRRAMDEWSIRLTRALRQAQECGQVRTDLPADQLSTIFLNAWEGSLQQMKLARTTEAPKKTVATLLEVLFRPPGYIPTGTEAPS